MSNRSFTAVISAVLILLSQPTWAQMSLAPLNGSEIRSQLFGRTMQGEYPDGVQWAEKFNADGSSDYSQDGKISRGDMTINGNILCFTYKDGPTTGGCFEVWKRGPNCFDFYATNNGATLDERRFGRAWSARGWYVQTAKTCVSENIS